MFTARYESESKQVATPISATFAYTGYMTLSRRERIGKENKMEQDLLFMHFGIFICTFSLYNILNTAIT